MFRGYDPEAVELDVPDPYYGGEEGLVEVVEMARAAARGLAAIPGEDGS
jgi:protein-tyrosine phosphatase